MTRFGQNFDRKSADIKTIRNDLMGMIGGNEPWEVAVDQVIGHLVHVGHAPVVANRIRDHLGAKVVTRLLSDCGRFDRLGRCLTRTGYYPKAQ